MRRPPSLLLAAASLGIFCVAILLWIWSRDRLPEAREVTAHSKVNELTQPPATAPLPRISQATHRLHPLVLEWERAMARGDARPGEAVLSFKDRSGFEAFLARSRQAGLTILDRSDVLRAVRVRVDGAESLQRDLADHPEDYAAVAANGLFGIPRPPAKEDRPEIEQIPFRNETLEYLGASGDRSQWGRGTTIAVLDTGIGSDATFGGRVRTLDIGQGLAPGPRGEDGHGTGVAALAAGAANDAAGLAPAANLLSIRVTDANGLSDLFTLSQGIVTAVNAGAHVINISLGGYSTGAMLEAAIAYAQERGAVVVAAAGNDQAARLAWPAADARVISVGAIDRAEQQVTFSNSSAGLQLSAPGYGVQTAWRDNQRAYVNGTSASAPLVSGAIAAVMSQNPNLTAAQAAGVLLSTASDGGAPGADAAFGRGILNIGWAMNRSQTAYVDTAVATHHFDSTNNQMQFVVQNRSGRAVSGLALDVAVGNVGSRQTVPSLAPGETYIARLPVSDVTLRTNGTLTFTTQLTNPIGVNDQVPANNRRTSTLTAPKP